MIHSREDYQRIQDPERRIPEDEPVFLVRAQDPAASAAVRAWADQNDRVGGDQALSFLARQHASRMDAWPKKKPADLPRPGIHSGSMATAGAIGNPTVSADVDFGHVGPSGSDDLSAAAEGGPRKE